MFAFNTSPFNACAFNAESCPVLPATEFWLLFLDPEGDNTFITSGTGLEIPPNFMFPGQVYLIEKRLFAILLGGALLEVECLTQFRTPPAITFDELGG